MITTKLTAKLLTAALAILFSYNQAQGAVVSDERLRAAQSDTDNWLSHGRSYREQRFSPLKQVDTHNVEELGLAWYFESDNRFGLEATPLAIDGTLYVSGSWSVVYALDARDGSLKWLYDPQVPRETSYKYCCGPVNRGVAAWDDNIYIGTLDGRLVSLNAQTGALNWEVQTLDSDKPYSITGAPRIANGKVIIGNGGAEFGVRGYVSAYDGETGEQVWRFYTVPGNPAEGFENAQMEMAAETWTGEWWQYGGGGTVWDSIAFDPELNLLYIGVGNGSPHNQQIRSPQGGDNLFLTSIVALNADTGEYAWHYQQVNGETWDYTATQQMVLLDIDWQGQPRKVIMQAPKAGFFYIIDRTDGELLSAEPFVKVTWASEVDMDTGRPVEHPEARYPDGSTAIVFPTGLGGHNWHSMAYSPDTGLMYIPATDLGGDFTADDNFQFEARQWNLGYTTASPGGDQLLQQAMLRKIPAGFLLAWDPIEQREAWRVPYQYIGNGGALATAGNLVFQGSVDGFFHAYRADDGAGLWSMPVQSGVVAAPISYAIDGEQYITVLAGRGGGMSQVIGIQHEAPQPAGRVLTFKLGGKGALPALKAAPLPPAPPELTAVREDDLLQGQTLLNKYCARCHGVNAVSDGSIPDLRHMAGPIWDNFENIVLRGFRESTGMPRFDDVLSVEQTAQIKAYLNQRANEDEKFRQAPTWWVSLLEWFYGLIAGIANFLLRV